MARRFVPPAPAPTPTVIAIQLTLAILVLLTAATFVHRSPDTDDAWLGEQAYWLAHDGFVHSELFRGMLGYEGRIFVFHKLFILSGAAFIRLCGWSLYVLQSVSLFYFLVFLLLFYLYYRRSVSKLPFLLSCVLLLAHGLITRFIFVFRPEIMLMMLGFLSFLLLDRYYRYDRLRFLVGSAVVAGLCVSSHLNGIIFIFAGVGTLLCRKGIKSALIFTTIAIPVASLYFADASIAGEMPQLIHQLVNDPALKGKLDFGAKLWNLLNEHKRFFHGRGETAFSLLVIVVLGTTLRQTISANKFTSYYLVLLVVSLSLVAREHTSYYAIIYLPYFCILCSYGILEVLSDASRRRSRTLILIVFAVYALNGIAFAAQLAAGNTDIPARNRRLAHRMTEKEVGVVAPLDFVFNEIGNYRITGLMYYWIYRQHELEPLTVEALFDDARGRGAKYFVTRRAEFRFSLLKEEDFAESGPNYRRIYSDEEHSIYEIKARSPQ